jgi:hypothetical protein
MAVPTPTHNSQVETAEARAPQQTAEVRLRTPQECAEHMFARLGKEAAYTEASFWADNIDQAPATNALFWQDVASLIDAMSPCGREGCKLPGIRWANDVWACDDHAWAIENDPREQDADDAYSERGL